MTELKKEDLTDFQAVHIDPVGDIYEYDGKMLRIINKKYARKAQQILSSGLVKELVKNRLMVATKISEYTFEDSEFVLESPKIIPSLGGAHWSFDMMKDAALLVLRVNKICNKYGYEIKDCHQANIVFNGADPLWVDFGSIIKKNGTGGWTAKEEFIKTYYIPMMLWSKDCKETVHALMKSTGSLDINELIRLYYHIPKKFCRGYLEILTRLHTDYYENRIKRLTYHESTIWGNYQDNYGEHNGRFDYEIDWINQKDDIHSIVEIGANQGVFSYIASKKTRADRIIATDYDREAVNILYKRLKAKKNEKVVPLVIDFVWEQFENLRKCRCDLLVANALVHHLLITQGMSIKCLVDKLDVLTDKYLIVEFTRTGVDKRTVPAWYTEDWFVSNISERFHIIETNRNVCKDRTLFICRKK